MKILFLTLSHFSSFPTYKRAIGMGEELALMGDAVYIAVMDSVENRERMRFEAPHCIPLWFRNAGVLREVYSKVRMCWHLKPDVVYSTSYSVRNLAFLRVLLPTTCLVTEFCELYSQVPRRRLTWQLREVCACFESSRIIVASQYLQSHFEQYMKQYKCSKPMLYSPYAYPQYLRPKLQKACNHEKNVVYMASLWKGYGVWDVVESFRKVLALRSDIRLLIIGGGPEKNALMAYLKEKKLSEKIVVLGYVPEDALNDYFSLADVFVSPIFDTIQDKARCPSKIFYYIAYNKPIVTCRIGEPANVLKEYGFYYRSGDVQSMAETIKQALDQSLTFSYPEGFLEKHSWKSRAVEFKEWVV